MIPIHRCVSVLATDLLMAGHSGATDGFRGRMVAHRTGGFGVVILTNSDNGHLLSDAVVELIGKREGWPDF